MVMTVALLLVCAVLVSAPPAQAYDCGSCGMFDSCYGSWCICQKEWWCNCFDYYEVWGGGPLCQYYCGFGYCILYSDSFEYCDPSECD
jgi:hypothetical protein